MNYTDLISGKTQNQVIDRGSFVNLFNDSATAKSKAISLLGTSLTDDTRALTMSEIDRIVECKHTDVDIFLEGAYFFLKKNNIVNNRLGTYQDYYIEKAPFILLFGTPGKICSYTNDLKAIYYMGISSNYGYIYRYAPSIEISYVNDFFAALFTSPNPSLATYEFSGTTVSSANIMYITDIPSYMFLRCTNLNSVIFTGTKKIGSHSFDNCTSLKSLDCPSSLSTIESYAFDGCTSLSSLTFNYGISTIDEYAFHNTAVENLVLPNTITSLGDHCFYACHSLSSLTLPSGISTILSGTFKETTSLTSLTIVNNIKTIESEAFRNSGLKSVNFGKGVTDIGTDTFNSCTSLSTMTFSSSSAPEITSTTFTGISASGTINVPNDSSIESYLTKGFLNTNYGFGSNWKIKGNNTYIKVHAEYKATGSSTTVRRYNATYFNRGYFFNNIYRTSGTTSITTTAGSSYSADFIIKMGTSSGGTIPASGFSGCTALETINLTNIDSIGEAAFSGCTNLSAVSFSLNSVLALSKGSFSGCVSLTNVSLPYYMNDTIPNSCFGSCTSLGSIYIPSTVTKIEQYAFAGCGTLTIRYGGSQTQWNSVTKENGWNYVTTVNMVYNAPS